MKKISLKTEIPGPKSRALMERRKQAVARGPFHATPIFASKGEGAWVEDVDGNRFLDFAAGIGVVNVGHAAPQVVSAVQEQAALLTHSSFNVLPYAGYVSLCEKLNAAMPGNFSKKTFLANSGAEAVENAIKIARAYTGRQAIVCFDHAFHGRTYMAMSLTAKAKPYRYGFAPFNSEVYRAPYPYAYRWQGGGTEAEIAKQCFAEFAELVNTQITPGQVAAVILEPVLGEGGFVPAPKEFLRSLRDFCTEHKIVLIADEIQTGFGRTGSLFASEQLGFTPDLITSAKGLGGGFPISAVTGRAEIMDAPIEGSIGGTFGGNPVACAAALAVFDIFQDPAFLKHAAKLGDHLKKRLLDWKERYKVVGDVRGLGPMLALEFVKNRETKEPHADLPKQIAKHAYENGVILMTAGTFSNVIRFLPPLCLETKELDEGLDVIEAGLKKYS